MVEAAGEAERAEVGQTGVGTAKEEGKMEKNPAVQIASVLATMTVAITAIVLIFARQEAWVLAPVVGSLAILGIFLGYFANKWAGGKPAD